MSDRDWKFGAALAQHRDQINTLAWLLAEEKWKNSYKMRYIVNNVEDWHGKATHDQTGAAHQSPPP